MATNSAIPAPLDVNYKTANGSATLVDGDYVANFSTLHEEKTDREANLRQRG
jgi:hypothetical protein